MFVLGLNGNGALHPRRLHGVLLLERGSIRLHATEPPTTQRR